MIRKIKRCHGYSGHSAPIFNLDFLRDVTVASHHDKTTTFVGRGYVKPYPTGDMISVINELVGGLKSSYIGAKKGGFNILNISRELYKNLDFWEVFNKPWLQAAIDRRDIFFAASDPTNLGNIFRSFKNVPTESLTSPEAIADYLATLDDAEIIKEMTFYGREIQLLSQNNYIFNTVNKKFEIP